MARKMKDSGIEWIGEIPEGWEVVPVKRLCTMQAGKNLTSEQIAPEGTYPVYGGNGIRGFFSDYNCVGQFLTVGRQGALCGNVHKINGKVWATEHAVITAPSSYAILDFLYYLLIGMDLNQYVSSTAAQPGLAVGTLLNLKTCYPCSTLEQTQISNYLNAKCSHIDTMLFRTRSSIEEYKKLKQAVITQAVTKGVRGEREMKNCNIGWVKELPADWGTIPSKYLFKNSDTKKCNGDEQLTASQQHGIITQKYYTELTGSKVVLANKGLDDWKHVEPFDFIISLRSFQGGLEMSETTGCITWHYIVLKPYHQIYSYYYKWLFKSEIYIRALQRTCNFIRDGQDLRYSNFVQVPLFEPPLEEQKEIADYLNAKCAEIDGLIAKKEQLVKELESYKKSLIYEVVTGKREV